MPLRSWVKTGDANLDGVVDGGDFLAWQRGFGKAAPSLTDGDFNGDGVVDGSDLTIWRGAFGAAGTVAVAAVPECNSIALAMIGAAGFVRRRRQL